MTVIAAKVEAGQIFLAGDRAVTEDQNLFISKQPKIASPVKNLLIGLAGDCNVCQDVLAMDWPIYGDEVGYAYMRRLNPMFKDMLAGYEDADLDILIGLITTKGPRLYSWGDGVILEHDYHAIGSGALVAIGALGAGATVTKACEIACEHIASCAGPIDTLRIG